MSTLDIDVGNTFLKWRIEGQALRGRVRHADIVQADWPELVSRVRVASVAGDQVNQSLSEFVVRRWNVTAEFARTTAVGAGVTNSYADPSRMGVDRWLAILSAWHRTNSECWVVDCGSAITVEQISSDGVHQGGYIIPGLQLMSKNLLSNTAEIIVDHSIAQFNAEPGTNTSEAVQHGLNLMLSALAEKIMRSAGSAPVYVTGGDGELFCSLASGSVWCPDLVMEGLPLAMGQ
ncbi:type III pantothenate kinase [Amphritea balenae]|uniref:Type III pantothenate kinase n=1 Tax=Amphritea balenae TaxID=452629 RepID=A0A3P1SK01_9GAMM|nr:type III pantothenate kinase [Amphritea balenae]RRC97396.1 type III pantothenate kinase [Amphritea balenae]GGK84042.1 type III pantothenate kinase [Amphritea balenae]